MTALLHRGFAAELWIRSGGDGRTVSGICVPYNQPAEVMDWGVRYQEQFAPGAFTRTIAHAGPQRVKFLAQHDRAAFPLGRAVELVDDPAKYPGLYGEFYVSKTERGDEALELIRDRALDGLSVGFAPVRSDPMSESPGALVTRHEVKLNEVSAVSFPAYDGARIAAVRGQDADEVMAALDAMAREGLSEEAVARLRQILDSLTPPGGVTPPAEEEEDRSSVEDEQARLRAEYDLLAHRARALGVVA